MENSIIKSDIKSKPLIAYLVIMYLILGASLTMLLGNFAYYNIIIGLPAVQSCIIGAVLMALFIAMFAWKLFNQELPSKCSLELTSDGINGRIKVIGSTSDLRLPIEKIDSLFVKNSLMDKFRGGKTLGIRSNTGVIKFVCVQNADAFVTAANKAIEESKKANKEVPSPLTTIVQNTSDADESKKYKDLLDNGVITQEEFDAKKKQLLGL